MTNRRYEVYDVGVAHFKLVSSIPDDLVEEAARRLAVTRFGKATTVKGEVALVGLGHMLEGEARAVLSVLFEEE